MSAEPYRIAPDVILTTGARLKTLAAITATQPAEWQIAFGPGPKVRAEHSATTTYITLLGGGEDSEEHILDQSGMCPTTKRIEMLRAGGGALGFLLIKEHHAAIRNNRTRQARRERQRAEEG